MRALVARELTGIAYLPALPAAVIAHAGALAAFVLVWGNTGMPVLPGTDIYTQLAVVQRVVLACVLPWAAVRLSGDRGDALIRLSALTAMPPSRLVAAKLAATSIALLFIVAGAWPVVILAQQMAAVPLWLAAGDQCTVAALALAIGAAAAAWTAAPVGRLLAWLAATASVLAVLALTPMSVPAAGLAAASVSLAAGIGAAVAVHADRARRYVSERRA